ALLLPEPSIYSEKKSLEHGCPLIADTKNTPAKRIAAFFIPIVLVIDKANVVFFMILVKLGTYNTTCCVEQAAQNPRKYLYPLWNRMSSGSYFPKLIGLCVGKKWLFW